MFLLYEQLFSNVLFDPEQPLLLLKSNYSATILLKSMTEIQLTSLQNSNKKTLRQE